jgi:chemotaxis protein methyltransferase CheR
MLNNRSPSDTSVKLLLNLIEERTGYLCENGRCARVLDKISPLVAERGFSSYLDYYYLLKYAGEAESEWRKVENALAVNETYFWREIDQIQAAAREIVPGLQKARPGQPVRIWHAACATGEEPYTMAITLVEEGCLNHGPVEIVATDFNYAALAQARAGVYRQNAFRSIPPEIHVKYFSQQPDGKYRLDDAIRSMVQFVHMNMMDLEAMDRMRGFDVIFCRNAFIYLTQAAIKQVVGSFYQSLNTPGFLFVAAVESLLRVTDLLEFDEIGSAFVYRK